MRIPLDYYRILGLPIQASDEQLQQAYRDRTVQLPRREYSEATIAARKQLIEKAYTVLSDPEQRSSYDASYLAHIWDRTAEDSPSKPTKRPELPSPDVALQTPSVEIPDEQFVGALLILQELGEYELVLKLGRPYLSSSSFSLENGRRSETDQVLPDVVLTVTLAYLELSREQWQQGQYENAATSLESSQEILLREGLFPSIQAEIPADLYKLRPYRILELLAQPEEKVAQRRQGLQLLQNVLQERGGIDGTGDDGSGLSIDDFLRFIQQLRSYLTATEQQSLFEAESQRPCAVATYLTVYALVARGFAQSKPALIARAKLLLKRLGQRQDLHLEQAVCSLLLGQTEEASRALELSHEYEPLAFIREHSQGSPDLLPGLCLYGERWLQTEVFPHFRDLVAQQASLKDYFANEQVQAYLEALPTEAEATVMAPEELTYAQDASGKNRELANVSQSREVQARLECDRTRRKQRVRDKARDMQTSSYPTAAVVTEAGSSSQTATARGRGAGEQESREEKDRAQGAEHELSLPQEKMSPTRNRQFWKRPEATQPGVGRVPAARLLRSKRRTRNQFARDVDAPEFGKTRIPRRGSSSTVVGNVLKTKGTRLVLLGVAGVLGIVVVGLVLSKTYGWLSQTFSPAPSLEKELPRNVQPLPSPVNQPPSPLPRSTKPVVAQGAANQPPSPLPRSTKPVVAQNLLLTPETAKEVIQTWLSTKAAVFGSNHAIDRLNQILAGPALSQWQELAQKDKADNVYRQYKHSLNVDSVQTSQAAPNQAQVEATVNEVAQLYEDGQLNQDTSYDQKLRVRYDLVRQGGQWRINDMTVLK